MIFSRIKQKDQFRSQGMERRKGGEGERKGGEGGKKGGEGGRKEGGREKNIAKIAF